MPNKNIFSSFEVKNMTSNSADLYFYGDIVSDWWGAWQDEDQYPDNIKNLLAEYDGKDLNIYINSGGGSVFAGIAIYNMIKRYALKHKVQVYVDGLAGSIASILAFAGSEKPIIPSNAYMMIHNPWTSTIGNAEDHIKAAETLEAVKKGIMAIYSENKCDGVTDEKISEMMDEETWLDGASAASIFDVEVGASVDAVAAVGETYKNYSNMPEKLKVAPVQQPVDDTSEKISEIQDKIKRLVIENLC